MACSPVAAKLASACTSGLGKVRDRVSLLQLAAQSLCSGNVFEPSDISGLTLWLDAGALALNDSDLVALWSDRSSVGNSVVQPTDLNKPSFKTGILNGNPVVRFNGTTSRMQTSNPATSIMSVSAYTAFSVVSPASFSTTFPATPWFNQTVFGLVNSIAGLGFDSVSPTAVVWNFDGVADQTSTGTSVGNHIYTTRLDSGNLYIKQDNNAETSVASGNSTDLNSLLRIGGNFNLSAFLAGDIAEMLIYNVALTANDRLRVMNYLNRKYAIF
jgi:hypothetical protein